MLVDGVTQFAEFLRVGCFRSDRVLPGHRRKIGEEVGPQADAVGPHQRAALMAAEVVFEPHLGIETGRSHIQAGGIVPRMGILPAETGRGPDRRMQFDAVNPVMEPRRPTQQASTTTGHEEHRGVLNGKRPNRGQSDRPVPRHGIGRG